MKQPVAIFLISILLSSSCNKKTETPEEEPVPPVVVTENPCKNLPPTPTIGWRDSTNIGDKNINAFFYNPINSAQVIYIVNGDAFGTNKMFAYNIQAQQKKLIDNTGYYLPQINKHGWVIYSNIDNNLFLWKSGPDSLMQLTNTNITYDPKWDYTGNAIYYFQEAILNTQIPSKLVKMSSSGNDISETPMDLPYTAIFKKSDKIIYLKVKDHNCTLTLRDMVTNFETALITGPTYSKPGQINFDNMTLDNNDENLYWSNSKGIIKCNLASLKIDTVFKNCESQVFDNPIISHKLNELTYNYRIITPLNTYILYHDYKAMEYNLVSGQTAEVKFFP